MLCTWIGLPILVADYLGRALSALANYNINKTVVFRNNNKSWITLIRYIMLLAISGTASACLIIILSSLLPISVGVIKVIVELVLYFVNYYVQHTFVFDNKHKEVTDWTAYYKKKKSFFSTFTQKATLKILKKYINKTISSLNMEKNNDAFSLLELGGGNSCFADELCDKCKIRKYDIIDNNKYATNLFKEKRIDAEHEAYCINLLEAPEEDIKQYDFVYSIGLIEHFLGDDIRMVIDQHFARTKNGGVVLISFPTPTIKYRFVRGIMEVLGVWQFADENPLRFDEVKDYFERNGMIEEHFLNNKLPLTQYVVVAKKK
jgi:putative flippase GtrA